MKPNKRLVDRIRDDDPIPAPLSFALSALTQFQRAGMALRRRQKVHRVNARVISVGNITAGGTGKTPAVIERARQEIAAGRRVAVLTRGYAAPSGSKPADSTDLAGVAPYHALGDEAALVLQKVPGIVVIKNADRVAGAHRAIALGCDTLILDDGFQQLRLARDEDIVLVDATKPFGNFQLVPRGILREPPHALSRATQIVVTHADSQPDDVLLGLYAELVAYAPNVPIRSTCHEPVAIKALATGEQLPLEWLCDREITLATGIAQPERFADTVETLEAKVLDAVSVPDHAPLDAVLGGIQGTVLITEKDAVRLAKPYAPNIYVLEIELRDCS